MSRVRPLVAVAVLAALALAGQAGAERAQSGNLIISLQGGLTPQKLPRHKRAPVAVELGGRVQTVDHTPLPRVNWIKLELAYRGKLDTRGLAICPKRRLRGTDTQQALAACGPARVGKGHLFAKIFVPNQPPFDVRAHLTAFNGRTASGRHAVLIHAYATDPPVSFVIPFSVHQGTGIFPTVLVALIRRSAGPWPHVADFQIKVGRRFMHERHQRSYLSASCPAPPGFTGAPLSLARATYSFEGGAQLSKEIVRSCHTRKEPSTN
jgi:hypothetical protein